MYHQQGFDHCRSRSIGRLSNRRLTLLTTADAFIRSLVLAGFCSEHAPKRRACPNLVHEKISSPKLRANSDLKVDTRRYTYSSRSRHEIFRQHRAFKPRVSLVHSKQISTYAAKLNLEEHDHHDSHQFPFTTRGKLSKKTDPVQGQIWKQSNPRTFTQSRPTTKVGCLEPAIIYHQPDSTEASTPVNLATRKEYTHQLLPELENDTNSNQSKIMSNVKIFLDALYDSQMSNQYVFNLYKRLPSPKWDYLSMRDRGQLLKRFARPPDRRRSNARFFLTIFTDMTEAGLPISGGIFTKAIYFTSHLSPVLQKRDLMNAMSIWECMELKYGLKTDNVVFQLLFRIAILSGHYEVGDRLLEEMKNRGLRFSRHGLVSFMYACGKRGDINGIHDAFKQFDAQFNYVDSSVVNCLISSLLNAGDPATAHQVYSHLLQNHARIRSDSLRSREKFYFPSLSSNFSSWRSKADNLSGIFRILSGHGEALGPQGYRKNHVPIVPDTRTYYIMLRYHCLHTGDISAVEQLLRDMETVFRNPPRIIVYYFLFQGFAIHSSAKGWTEAKLLKVWKFFKEATLDSYMRLKQSGTVKEPIQIPPWRNPLLSTQVSSPSESSGDQHNTQDENGVDRPDQKSDTKERTVYLNSDDDFESTTHSDKLPAQRPSLHEWTTEQKVLTKIPNGVFLSRSLNILILKAFGAHCDADTVLKCYLETERIWKLAKRTQKEVLSVKKELSRQLIKIEQSKKTRAKTEILT